QLGGAHRLGQEDLEKCNFGLGGVSQIRAAGFARLADCFLARYDLFLEDGEHGGVIQLTALLDFSFFSSGQGHAQRVFADGVARFHGVFEGAFEFGFLAHTLLIIPIGVHSGAFCREAQPSGCCMGWPPSRWMCRWGTSWWPSRPVLAIRR